MSPVHFGLDVGGHVHFLAALQQQLFVDQCRDQFGLLLRDFFSRLLLSHSVLFQRFDPFPRLALQHGKCDDLVVDLCDHFVNNCHLAFLGEDVQWQNCYC